MPILLKIRVLFAVSMCVGTVLCVAGAHAEMDPRFELDPLSLSGSRVSAKPQRKKVRRSSRIHRRSVSKPVKGNVYTVKQDDNIFKILMRDYGLSNNEAELLIEDIKRENNIYDIRRLKIGQKITIPLFRRSSEGALKLLHPVRDDNNINSVSATAPGQTFKLDASVQTLSEADAVTMVHNVWDQIVPSKNEQLKPLSFHTPTFSLVLDPERYPMFARMDGGRIILDKDGSIPPLVKSLIENKDALVRIVTEVPSGTKRFMASMLEAAAFYSVEKNFSMEFGVDPKLTVNADFKVEKTADSLLKQDVVLVNSGRTLLPPSLGEFLKKEGFSLYEPFAHLKPFARRDSRTICHISTKAGPEMMDSILAALAISTERDRPVDVFAADNNGISLSVNAGRYFERGGQRYVVTRFDGDPINYTLFRILETKGFKVVVSEDQDDFRKTVEKLISRMNIKGNFAQHGLLQDHPAGYSLQMSGFKLDDPLLPGGGIFLTDRPIDKVVRNLFTENGINIDNR